MCAVFSTVFAMCLLFFHSSARCLLFFLRFCKVFVFSPRVLQSFCCLSFGFAGSTLPHFAAALDAADAWPAPLAPPQPKEKRIEEKNKKTNTKQEK